LNTPKIPGLLFLLLAADRFDVLGQEKSREIFNDRQHTKKPGARINAECVVAGRLLARLRRSRRTSIHRSILTTDDGYEPDKRQRRRRIGVFHPVFIRLYPWLKIPEFG